MFENPRRGRQAINFTINVSKILNLKSSSEQIFFQKLSLGAPEIVFLVTVTMYAWNIYIDDNHEYCCTLVCNFWGAKLNNKFED